MNGGSSQTLITRFIGQTWAPWTLLSGEVTKIFLLFVIHESCNPKIASDCIANLLSCSHRLINDFRIRLCFQITEQCSICLDNRALHVSRSCPCEKEIFRIVSSLFGKPLFCDQSVNFLESQKPLIRHDLNFHGETRRLTWCEITFDFWQ